jgi:type IV pilus assembly protein PilV
LIEVLIALVVVTVGLLGMAGIQTFSLRNNASAYARSVANNLAYDMLDAMRANRNAALANKYEFDYTGCADPDDCGVPEGDTRAGRDIRDWQALVQYMLNRAGAVGEGSVDCDAGTAVCTVTVQWNDNRVGTTGIRQQVIVSTRL